MPADRKPPGAGLFVLVAGWPGSGKSTLAAALAPELGLPLLAKDEIKEALMDALGAPVTVADSQRLGRAAVLAMLRPAGPAVTPVISTRRAAIRICGAGHRGRWAWALSSRSTPPGQSTSRRSPPP
jgi:adenylylsulfate kinase-like enzyme